jgi:hypothetical protein
MEWLKPSQASKVFGVLLSTTAAVTGAQAQSFGKVGAVNQEATGTPPGGATRKLTVGTGIVVKERVRTSASGSTQIQFPDQSAINLGANCDLVIDQFVYDPQAKSGAMVATATKGVLRFIGGNISHNAGATIRTPSASLGIRGGMVTVLLPLPPSIAQQDPALAGLSGELVIAHFGQITLSNNVSNVNLKSGFATVIGSPNDPILTPFRVSEATLKLIMQLINSKPGQTGGVANIPTQGNVPPGFKYTIVQDPTNPPGTNPLGYLSIFAAGNGAAKGTAQTNQVGSVNLPPPPPPPPSETSGGGCCI